MSVSVSESSHGSDEGDYYHPPRHLKLYSQGMESIRTRYERILAAKTQITEAELRECSFNPILNSQVHPRRFTEACSQPPKLYSMTIERIRKGIKQRQLLELQLAPRLPMTQPRPHSLDMLRKQRRNFRPDPQSITVEVTKDGPGGVIQFVGKFVLKRDSNTACIAAKFAQDNRLNKIQQDRLQKQLEIGKENAFM